jgi:hypothetical protein
MAPGGRGAELLLLVTTEKKNSTVIVLNESLVWTATLTDLRLSAAIVDRVTFNATSIETGTGSHCLAHNRQQFQNA